VVFTESVEERSRWIGAMPSKNLRIENQLCIEIDCSVYPTQVAVDPDSSLVNRDPRRLRRRRVGTAVSQPMCPLKDRLMRAFHAARSENRFCLSNRTTGRVEPDGERPNGRRRPLTLPIFI
jgi:hypothetical protein